MFHHQRPYRTPAQAHSHKSMFERHGRVPSCVALITGSCSPMPFSSNHFAIINITTTDRPPKKDSRQRTETTRDSLPVPELGEKL